MKFAIFGAQGYALGAYEAIKTLYPRRQIGCFLVTKMGMNAPLLGGIPVREIDSFSAEIGINGKKNIEVLIATPENVQPEIEETLENYGFHYYRRLDSVRWGELMKLYHVRMNRFQPLSALPVGFHSPFVRVYMARSEKDRVLKNGLQIPDYMFPIHAGAAKSAVRVADLADNKGTGISERNGNYSELTVLYWMWKNKLICNGTEDGETGQYYGLAQYRRFFDFEGEDLLRLVDNDVDVVLPYPMPYEPNIHAHHERYLQDVDWKALLAALSEFSPDYAAAFSEILEQKYLYNYNVILAKKKVLRDYCEWLFPILMRTEELSVPKGSERSDRYIGYMGETLETLYFMKNADKLNIVHTCCKLYT